MRFIASLVKMKKQIPKLGLSVCCDKFYNHVVEDTVLCFPDANSSGDKNGGSVNPVCR